MEGFDVVVVVGVVLPGAAVIGAVVAAIERVDVVPATVLPKSGLRGIELHFRFVGQQTRGVPALVHASEPSSSSVGKKNHSIRLR